MEIHLQELLDKIKKDGVEVAEGEAKAIVDSAKAEAEKIISDAKAKAEKIISDAKAENEKIVNSGEDAITQAGRNLLISFRQSVATELSAVVGENVNAVYSSDALAETIAKVVENWSKNPNTDNLSVILNSDDLEKPNDNFDGGFRIAVNNGAAYYDYSAEAVTEMLSNYLSPKVTELLKKAE